MTAQRQSRDHRVVPIDASLRHPAREPDADFGHRLRLMVAILLSALGAVTGVNYAVDPLGAWRGGGSGAVYRSMPEERLAIPYLLRNSHPSLLLLGTSRVAWGMRIEQGIRGDVLNAAMLGATLKENALEIEIALENPRLKRIVWGLDFMDFSEAMAARCDPNTCERLRGDWSMVVADTLLSVTTMKASGKLIRRAWHGRRALPPEATISVPWPKPAVRGALENAARKPSAISQEPVAKEELGLLVGWYREFRYSPLAMQVVRDSVEQARRAGVEMKLFVAPTSEYEVEIIRQTGTWHDFLRWKRDLAAVEPYYDFSGYGPLAESDQFYLDVAHIRPAVGNLILRILLSEDYDGLGDQAQTIIASATRVDAQSVDRVVAGQDRAMRAAAESDTRYSRVARDALAVRKAPLPEGK